MCHACCCKTAPANLETFTLHLGFCCCFFVWSFIKLLHCYWYTLHWYLAELLQPLLFVCSYDLEWEVVGSNDNIQNACSDRLSLLSHVLFHPDVAFIYQPTHFHISMCVFTNGKLVVLSCDANMCFYFVCMCEASIKLLYLVLPLFSPK